MRDPKRIREFCNQLAEIWETQCPDWRFGQLVENVYRLNAIPMPFFVEDDKMLLYFRKTFHLEENTDDISKHLEGNFNDNSN